MEKILIIDDSLVQAAHLKNILSEDYDVTTVQTPKDGLAQAAAGDYSLIMLDVVMPEMNGFEAASAIRGLDRADAAAIPIIAVSADAFADDVQKCMDCGMNAHTAKPYDFGKIIGLLNQLLQ